MLSSWVSVQCKLHGGSLKTTASRMEVIWRVPEAKGVKSMSGQKELVLLKTWEFIESIKWAVTNKTKEVPDFTLPRSTGKQTTAQDCGLPNGKPKDSMKSHIVVGAIICTGCRVYLVCVVPIHNIHQVTGDIICHNISILNCCSKSDVFSCWKLFFSLSSDLWNFEGYSCEKEMPYNAGCNKV